ncbi:MAG TPA: acyl-CoA thioesterase [Planctomycetes bacterium]|nr:acyl-CoA thioesterase [Planctomycetota bacterium]
MEFPVKITIDSHTITIVPRYCETDQAGVVHHTVYPVWFEMGRTELLRTNGLAYRELEKAGVYFVVTSLNIKYHKPALYDENLELTTNCTSVSTARIEHSYCLKRQCNGLILAEGSSTLACVDDRGKVRRMPAFMFPADPAGKNPSKNNSYSL